MILDEPTSDLDMKTKEILSEILWELGRERIIFIVTHERNLFERFSDIKTIYLKLGNCETKNAIDVDNS